MKINVWEARALADEMVAHDEAREGEDDSLRTAYVDAENVTAADGETVLVAKWEDGHRRVFWHDGQDVTSDYPHLEVWGAADDPESIARAEYNAHPECRE